VRIGLYFMPQPAQGLSDGTLMRLRRVADELDARVVIHLDELPDGISIEGHGDRARDGSGSVADGSHRLRWTSSPRRLTHLQSLGLLRAGFGAIGALGCDAEEAQLLSRYGAALIACPQAELRLQRERVSSPTSRPDALGTDTPAAAGALDMLAEARCAALLFGLTPLEALRLATLGGAITLGLGGQIGSIETGKSADLACIDLDAAGCRPVTDVAAAILFGATRAQISDVWCSGRAAVSEGRLRLFDEAELAGLAAHWTQRLALEAAA